MKLWHGWLCALSLLPASALADGIDYGSIDAFYVPRAQFDAKTPALTTDTGGNGFGVRVLSRMTNSVMFTGEYAHDRFDGGPDTNQYRVGIGLALPSTSGVFATYERLALDFDDANGVALHARAAGELVDPVSVYGDAAFGIWDAKRFRYDGFEFTLGATVDLPKPWGLFMDYRTLRLDAGDRPEHVQEQFIRVGVRYRFDC